MSLITVDDLKPLMNIDFDDPTSDQRLQDVIDAAVSLAEEYTGRFFELRDASETRLGTDSKFMLLRYCPIDTLSSVKLIDKSDGSTIDDITSSVSVDDSSTGRIILLGSGWFLPTQYYQIDYRTGYNVAPSDIKYALLLLAQHLYYQSDRVKTGVVSVSTPDGSYAYDNDAIPRQVRGILDRYVVTW